MVGGGGVGGGQPHPCAKRQAEGVLSASTRSPHAYVERCCCCSRSERRACGGTNSALGWTEGACIAERLAGSHCKVGIHVRLTVSVKCKYVVSYERPFFSAFVGVVVGPHIEVSHSRPARLIFGASRLGLWLSRTSGTTIC